jgi:Flp pilus assembly protein TadG
VLTIKQIARKLVGIEASEIAEAAIVFPLLFTFLLGIIWFGRAFNIYSTIQQAAQQGAIAAARDSCATCGNIQTVDTTVVSAVTAVLQASSLPGPLPTNTKAPTPLSCIPPSAPVTCTTTPGNITICRQALLNSTASQPPQCGVIVSFQYPFTMSLPFTSLNMSQITLTAQAQSRMEN